VVQVTALRFLFGSQFRAFSSQIKLIIHIFKEKQMDFLSKLLQGIAFVPSIVTGIARTVCQPFRS